MMDFWEIKKEYFSYENRIRGYWVDFLDNDHLLVFKKTLSGKKRVIYDDRSIEFIP